MKQQNVSPGKTMNSGDLRIAKKGIPASEKALDSGSYGSPEKALDSGTFSRIPIKTEFECPRKNAQYPTEHWNIPVESFANVRKTSDSGAWDRPE